MCIVYYVGIIKNSKNHNFSKCKGEIIKGKMGMTTLKKNM